ncbi:MAG: hypothetical protein FWE05_12680 [Defluviitaleaceae bacterium]|nr:hypothetical protein [Defluviitaleaceae bacterium]
MNAKQFYNYIVNNYNLDGTALRLVCNILDYVVTQEFADVEDAHAHLSSLLGDVFELEKWEIQMFKSNADYEYLATQLSNEELERAVEYIYGHEVSNVVSIKSTGEPYVLPFQVGIGQKREYEYNCGCISDHHDNIRHYCWAGSWLTGEWSGEQFVAHVKETVAEELAKGII